MIVKPLPPVEPSDRTRLLERDHAGKGAWSISALERMLQDCDEQPQWRDRADRACQFYDNIDNEQLTLDQKLAALGQNIPARAINLIGRVINGVLGQEAKTRRDPKLEADDDEFADVADALNPRLKEAQRETGADMAISAAYGPMTKCGIGWVEVSRNADPFRYQYNVEDVPRDQMWWDWRGRRIDTSDWRWICRTQWKDLDEVTAWFPEHAAVLERAIDSWSGFFQDGPVDEAIVRHGFADLSATNRFRTRSAEWRDGTRRRIRLYNVQYRVPAMVVILRSGHRKIVVDPQNPLHAEAVRRGVGQLERVPTMQIRNAIYAGPFRLVDEPTRQKRFKWVPFFAFRRDADDTPYGLIENMIAPQEDYNEASQRVRWMLKAQQLWMDSDALDEKYNTIADIADDSQRADLVAVMNPNRRNGANAIKLGNDISLQKELIERMQESKILVQDVPGANSPLLGNTVTGVTSGIALNSLLEQGITAMGEMNDNYLLGRRAVFENLVDFIVEDHEQADLQVKVGSGSSKRVIALNTVDPRTRQPANVVKDAPVKLGLGEAPPSPAYQLQTSQMIGDMVRALAGTPHAGLLIPSWVEGNSMFGPDRRQIADDMRRATGLPTAGDRAGVQQWQQMQQQQATQNATLQNAAAEAEVVKRNAEARDVMARTDKTNAETLKTLADVAQGTAANEDQMIEESLREALGA